MANLINFGAFGIPYTGPILCGYRTGSDTDLCARYFQLSVLSPLAIMQNDDQNFEPLYFDP
jgi:alpha-glucosidase (family GH31 glycosyl hydrolase)